MKSAFTLLLLLATMMLVAQPGTLDNGFGNGGKVLENGSAPAVSVIDMVLQADGKPVLMAKADYEHRTTVVLLRYNTNGTPDNTFDTDGIVVSPLGPPDFTDNPTAIQLQADGKILVCGNTYSNISVAFVSRYNTNGSPDSSFGTNGTVYLQDPGISNLSDLLVLPSGQIVLLTTSSDPFHYLTLIKLNPNGSRTAGFGTNGIVKINVNSDYEPDYRKLALQADGKMIAGGTPYRYNGPDQNNFVLVRVNAAGTLDSSYASNGILERDAGPAETDLFRDMVIQPDGKIVCSGIGSDYNRLAYTYISRIKTTGTPDSSYGTNGSQFIPTGPTGFGSYGFISLQSDGKVVVAGYARNLQGNDNIAAARLTNTGIVDISFDGDGVALLQVNNHSSFGITPLQQTNGNILLAGIAGNGAAFSTTIGRFTPAGATDNTIGTGGTAIRYIGASKDFDIGTNLLVRPDQRIVNIRKRANGYAQDITVTRHLPNGSLDSSWGSFGNTHIDLPGTYSATYASLLSNGKLGVVCNFKDYIRGGQIALFRFTANGNADSTFGINGKLFFNTGSNGNIENTVLDAKVLSTGKTVLLTNEITNLSLPDIGYLVRLNADGSVDASLNGNGRIALSDTLQYLKIVVQPDSKMVIVFKGRYGGSPNIPSLIRYNADGTVDNTFNGGNAVETGVEEPLQITVQTDGKIVVAGAYDKISRLNSNGTFDTSFDGDGIASPGYQFNNFTDLTLQPDGKIILGGNQYSPSYDSLNFQAIRINPNGRLDSTFGSNGTVWVNVVPENQNNAQAIALQADGKILMSGYTTYSYTYNSDFAMIRLLNQSVIPAVVYIFNGSGSWTVATNWLNGMVPPAILPAGSSIIIDPPAAGICYLNTVQHISTGASLTVKTGKQLVVIGNLIIQ